MKRFIAMGVSILLGVSCATLAVAQDAQKPVLLTRDEAVALALQHNPALREDSERTAAARATTDLVRSAEQLQFNVNSRYSTVNEVPTISIVPSIPPIALADKTVLTTNFSAQQVIYSGGRLPAQVRQAQNIAQAVEVNNQRTRQRVAFVAESTFYQYYAALRDQNVAQQALADAESHLKVAQARYDARAVPQFDVLHAEVQVQEAQQNLIQAQSGIEIAHAALLQALGLPAGSFTTSDADLEVPATMPNRDEQLQQARTQRPELQAIDWQLKAADAAVLAARGERKPTVALTANYQWVTPESLMLGNQLTLAAVASLPVLDGGAAGAKIRQAEAQREQLRAQRDTVSNGIATEVRQAYAQAVSANAQITVARKRLQEAEELFRVANVRYEGGVGTPTEVADALTTLTTARQGVTRALTAWGIASAQLRYATGQPIPVTTAKETPR